VNSSTEILGVNPQGLWYLRKMETKEELEKEVVACVFLARELGVSEHEFMEWVEAAALAWESAQEEGEGSSYDDLDPSKCR
jgi:hypothetical protein